MVVNPWSRGPHLVHVKSVEQLVQGFRVVEIPVSVLVQQPGGPSFETDLTVRCLGRRWGSVQRRRGSCWRSGCCSSRLLPRWSSGADPLGWDGAHREQSCETKFRILPGRTLYLVSLPLGVGFRECQRLFQNWETVTTNGCTRAGSNKDQNKRKHYQWIVRHDVGKQLNMPEEVVHFIPIDALSAISSTISPVIHSVNHTSKTAVKEQ